MKKTTAIIIVIVIFAALLFFVLQKGSDDTGETSSVSNQSPAVGDTGDSKQTSGFEDDDLDREFDSDNLVAADKVYNSADEALKAVKAGALEYDDLIMEQFADLGKECRWCPEFYEKLVDQMLALDATEDEQSYFSEILAISNRLENVKAVVDAVKNAPSQRAADTFAESLELTMGDDNIVSYLAQELQQSSDNELMEESLVAALTNHGSRLAVENLYAYTVEKGDPDGMYSLGIGLGEIIPDDDTIPYLVEMMSKGNEYSPLVAKALLNADYKGFQLVADYAANIRDEQKLSRFLTDAIDHVIYSEETEGFVLEQLKKDNPKLLRDFYQEVLEEFNIEKEEDLEYDDDELDDLDDDEDY